MIRWSGLGAWLTVVWVALWGDVTVANVGSGLVLAAVLLAVFPLRRDARHGSFRPLAALRFLAFLAWDLLVSNARVAWEVVTPGHTDNEGVIALPVPASCTQTMLALIVNSIGITPGAMVVDLTESPRVLYVHVLHLDDVEAERAKLMRFQALAVRAFGSAAAIAELDRLALATPGGTG